MNDKLRKDLKELCYHIIENPQPEALPDQLSQAQALYERLVVLNYLSEQRSETEAKPQDAPSKEEVTPTSSASVPPVAETLNPFPEPRIDPSNTPSPRETLKPDLGPIEPSHPQEEIPHRESAPSKTSSEPAQSETKSGNKPSISERAEADQQPSLNDRLAKGTVQIGLNDRLAFVKHLFGGNQEDFNRVLSQLNTFERYEEAQQFLDQMVKPDYDWDDKEEYENRLQEILLKSFGEQ